MRLYSVSSDVKGLVLAIYAEHNINQNVNNKKGNQPAEKFYGFF